MQKKKDQIQCQLDELAQEIYREDQELLSTADKIEQEEADKRLKKLETLRKIYGQNQKIPVWPINITLFSKFIAAQTIPVLSLIGIAEPIANILHSLLQSLSGS